MSDTILKENQCSSFGIIFAIVHKNTIDLLIEDFANKVAAWRDDQEDEAK